ncbi:MAG TPA: glycerate-2-kinase family protein, partial [Blastocatellia bacterium]|nr:glycerate-2-kinase family protein [Blastocatellia bacterium]
MTSPTEAARDIFLKTLSELGVKVLVEQRLKVDDNRLAVNDRIYNLTAYDKVTLIGFGKASASMGESVEKLLKDRLGAGLLVSNFDPGLKLKSRLIVAGHPLPDENSFEAGAEILNLVRSSGEKSLIIFLISGGGSAMVEHPISPLIRIDDLRSLNKTLINCGATIKEINTVRSTLSRIKGGRLGYEARRSDIIALYLSDVNAGDLESIASGPLLPNASSPLDFQQVIDRYSLREKLPASILDVLDNSSLNDIPDRWASRAKSEHVLLADNRYALGVA